MTDQISHPELVRKLFKDPRTINLSPEQVNLLHAAVGLTDEASEVLSATPTPPFRFAGEGAKQLYLNEIGDTLFYFEALCQAVGYVADMTDPNYFEDDETVHTDAVGLAVATGAVLGLVKKMLFNNRSGLRDNLLATMAEVATQLSRLCERIDCTIDDARQANITKLSARYRGLEYSDEAAAARRDEQ